MYRSGVSILWERPPSCEHEQEFFKKNPKFNHLKEVTGFSASEKEVFNENGVYKDVIDQIYYYTYN